MVKHIPVLCDMYRLVYSWLK